MSNNLSVPTQSIFNYSRAGRNTRRAPVDPVTSQSTDSQDSPTQDTSGRAPDHEKFALTRLQATASPSLLTIGSPLNQAVHFQKSSKPGTFGISRKSQPPQIAATTQIFQVASAPESSQANTDWSIPEEAPRSNKRRGQIGSLGTESSELPAANPIDPYSTPFPWAPFRRSTPRETQTVLEAAPAPAITAPVVPTIVVTRPARPVCPTVVITAPVQETGPDFDFSAPLDLPSREEIHTVSEVAQTPVTTAPTVTVPFITVPSITTPAITASVEETGSQFSFSTPPEVSSPRETLPVSEAFRTANVIAPVTTKVSTEPVAVAQVTHNIAIGAPVTTVLSTTVPVKETEHDVSISTPQKFEGSFRTTPSAGPTITRAANNPAPVASKDYARSISESQLYELLYQFNRRCSLQEIQAEPAGFLDIPSPPPEAADSPFFVDEEPSGFLAIPSPPPESADSPFFVDEEPSPHSEEAPFSPFLDQDILLEDAPRAVPEGNLPGLDDDLILELAGESLDQEDEDLVLEDAPESEEVTAQVVYSQEIVLVDAEDQEVLSPQYQQQPQDKQEAQLTVATLPVQTDNNTQATLPQISQNTDQKAEEDRIERVDCNTTPLPTTLVVSDSVLEAKDNIVAQGLTNRSIYIPLPIDVNNNQSILEGLKHKAAYTGDSVDIQAVQVFEQCLTNTLTCPAANDIARLEVRSEINFIVTHLPGILPVLEQIGSQIIVADLVHLPSYCKLALIITYDTSIACELQLLLKQRLEEVQRQQELEAFEIAKQEELRRQEWIAAQPLRSLIPDPNRGIPIATPVSSGKKISIPTWKIQKRGSKILSQSPRSSLFNFPPRSRSPRAKNLLPHLAFETAISLTPPVKQPERRQRRLTSSDEKTALRSLLITNIKRGHIETPLASGTPLESRPKKRSYQDFLENDHQPESLSEILETSEAVLIAKGSKYCVRAAFYKLWPKHFRVRTRSQRSGKYVERVVHQGTRYPLTTMLAAKRLCVESLNAISVNLENAQRAMFGTEMKTSSNRTQTTKKSGEPSIQNPHQNDAAVTPSSTERKEGNSLKDFVWDDNPKLNQPTKLSAPESQNETSGESQDGSNDESVQNIGLAGLLLRDEKEEEKSPLRLELSERRAELRSQEKAERQRKAQEEEERKILEEKLRAERLGRIQLPDGSSLFQDLSDELEELVERAVNTHQPHKQLCLSFEGVPLHGQDFQRLKAGAWLNDEIINAFIGLNVQHVKQVFGHKRKAIPVTEMFLSNFYTNLEVGSSTGDGAYSKVKRWASRKFVGGQDFLKCNLVITPVNLGNAHWTLLAFWPKHRVVEFYDSFQDPACSRKVLSLAKEYVEGELASLYIDSEWSFRAGKSPEQHNGYDCGVFVCTTAKMLLLGYEPAISYTGANMAGQRRRIAAELLKGELVGELEPTLTEDWLR